MLDRAEAEVTSGLALLSEVRRVAEGLGVDQGLLWQEVQRSHAVDGAAAAEGGGSGALIQRAAVIASSKTRRRRTGRRTATPCCPLRSGSGRAAREPRPACDAAACA